MGVLQVVLAYLLANVTTAIFFGGLWANFVLWREYSTTYARHDSSFQFFFSARVVHANKRRALQGTTNRVLRDACKQQNITSYVCFLAVSLSPPTEVVVSSTAVHRCCSF